MHTTQSCFVGCPITTFFFISIDVDVVYMFGSVGNKTEHPESLSKQDVTGQLMISELSKKSDQSAIGVKIALASYG